MFSTLVDVPLLLALIGTTVCTVMLYRRLKQLDAGLDGYRRMITESAKALDSASQAAKALSVEGRETVHALGHRIGQATSLLTELDDALTRLERFRPEPPFQMPLRHVRAATELVERQAPAPARESFKR
jgi:hypothetical protein